LAYAFWDAGIWKEERINREEAGQKGNFFLDFLKSVDKNYKI